ncbi:hypothetical protein KR222_011786, partial [Zaprionus bogoriensis]
MWVSGLKTFTGSYNCNNNKNNNNRYNYTNNDNNCKRGRPICLQPNFAQLIFCWPVIITLTFLMNDFRLKSLFRATKTTTKKSTPAALAPTTTTTTTTTTPIATATTTTTTTPTLGSSNRKPKNKRSASCNNKSTRTTFDNSNNNNPRTYNNSSKSNKVFLHYIPRDPRLRIFNRTATLNKHLEQTRRTLSELTIIEDLCNYGELIGGG